MAKGKQSSGKNHTSKGERRSSISTKNTDPGQKMLNKINALQKGKDVVWVYPNIGKDGKVHSNIRVKVSGKDYLARMKQNRYQQKEVVD
jgi:hypothetical protein